jgi:UPF0755 protein
MQKLLPKLIVASALLLIVLAYIASNIMQYMHEPVVFEEPVTIDFKPGSSIRTLSNQLQSHNLLEHPRYFLAWGRLSGKATRLQAGEYLFSPGQTIAELIDDMVAGRVRQYALTLVEGWTFRDFMDAITAHEAIDHTLKDVAYDDVMAVLGYEGQHPEGRFFPDTYFIHKNTGDAALLKRAYQQMEMHLNMLWSERDDDLPFASPYEALIMASIVEKESAVPEERPVIAGVFINRLRKGMRLQTDPTVIYGIGEAYDGDIRFRDLRTDTPYNTYTRNGLPPTPIAMPGQGALQAVMHPADTGYLYFVATGDGSGKHVFSATLEEHEKAVDKYQRKRNN